MSFADDIVALGAQAPAVASQLVSVMRAVGPILPTLKTVVDDPAFPGVITRIRTLHEIEAAKVTTPPVPSPLPSPASTAGIGLKSFLLPLDGLIYARRHPWAPWVVGGGLLLLIGGVGYKLGSRKRR